MLSGKKELFKMKKMLYFDYIGTVHELCPNGRISRKCHELGVKKLKIN